MASNAWDCITTFVPVLGGADSTHSPSFAIPRGTGAVTFHFPALDGSGATCTLQSLSPLDQSTYRDVTVFNLADGTFVTLDGMVENTCVTLPASAIGGGMFRFTFSDAQTAAAHITVMYDRL